MADVTREEYDARRQTCDERFARDKDRLKTTEEELRQLVTLVASATNIAQANALAIGRQEERLRALELKPGGWWDKVLTAGIGVAVGYIINMLLNNA